MATSYTENYHLKKPDYTDDADIFDINDDMDTLDTTIKGIADGKKSTQTAVTDPTASGTGIDFISGISQNTNGVISPAKKSVREMTGANGSAAGASGLVPAPAATDNGKFLRGDKTWATPTDTDTKNTAGATDTSSKIFLIGATSQGANPQTYSQDTAYVGTDGCLYSGGTKVLTSHQSISGKKDTQSAVSDPSASGTSLTFIASISQNAQGVISPAKKTVSTMGGASASSAGSAGLVPQPGTGNQGKFLRGDGTWQVPSNTTYSAGTGISISGTTVAVANSGVSAGSYGPSANVTGNNGATINVPQITVDATGRVTSVVNRVYTSVDTNTNTDTKNTAGATNTNSKIYLIGATSQDTNPQTYSHSTCYEQNGDFYDTKLHNAVWNDYAECRESNETQPGRCVRETILGVMVKTDRRRMRGCKIISDTYGTIMGETDKAKTPIGVAGRVLAYPARNRNKFYLGAPVCSGPDGTVDVMSRIEAILFPECIIGTVSEIPNYEKWLAGEKDNPTEIDVNGRIWIYVR